MASSNGVDADVLDGVRRAVGDRTISAIEIVQALWGGYGQIVRCALDGGGPPSVPSSVPSSVIVKHVRAPDERDHPYGWTSDRSHERKLKSYQVETAWYEHFASLSDEEWRVPRCLALETRPDGVVLVLEDLDAAGFDKRHHRLDAAGLDACLSWLANFHATFMGRSPEGLWETGTYWHLETRPDELDALDDGPLKAAAHLIDRQLSDSPFQTFVHGDAKLANFCFNAEGDQVAAVDFQYVGGGCGMKDVAYFISSCFDEDESEIHAPALLDRYFQLLGEALSRRRSGVDIVALEADWRALYPVAWTDFIRFLKGWSPGHWKLHGYSERLARDVLDALS